MKFGVCAIIKNENLYLREWVEHYINLGFDKIILYDNNEPNGEYPGLVIQDYIDNGYVDVINYRYILGYTNNFSFSLSPQISAYNDCLEKYKNDLDWIAFFDVDEFLELIKVKNIHQQFEDVDYNKFNCVVVFWRFYGSPDTIYYDNKKIVDRNKDPFDKKLDIYHVKAIVKTKSDTLFTEQPHVPESKLYCLDDLAPVDINPIDCCLPAPQYVNMYIKHYYAKSFYEFLFRKLDWWNPHKSKKDVLDFCKIMYKKYYSWSDEHEKIYNEFCDKYC